MQSIYVHGDVPGKPLPFVKKVATRPQGGTAHRHGWTEQVRLLRATLAAAHAVCPRGVRGDRESVALEILEFIGDLDPRAIHLLRTNFKIL